MRQRTEFMGARVYPGTRERVIEVRDQLAALYPDRIVTVADAIDIMVNSASAALASGTLHGLPPTGGKPDGRRP